MGIALSAVHGLFTPLQDLLAWFLSPVQQRRLATPPVAAVATPSCVATRVVALPKAAGCARRAHHPLRVVRVMDKDGPRHPSGARMVISGRMADVCAELDRLAALEAARH